MTFIRHSLTLLAVAAAATLALQAGDWPQFRGPNGQGIARDTQPPLSWSEDRNITWKKKIAGLGWSSPVIGGGKLWLTTAAEEGKSLRVLALDPTTGDTLHDIELFRFETPPKINEKNSYASPTPILEDGRVYVHFGTQGTAALSVDAQVLWKTQELRYYHRHGSSGSPATTDDLLLINCDGYDLQYVAALDKQTGEIRWKSYRGDSAHAYATPLVISTDTGKQLVSPGSDRTIAYDVDTGEELWWIKYKGFSNVPRPVTAHGLVYITSGFFKPDLFAIRPDGRGDITRTHVEWKYSKGVSLTPSPIIIGNELYMVSDKGIATCLDARTGEELWRQRLEGGYSASPVYAGGRIYFLNEEGLTTVIQPGREFEKLAESRLDGRSLASIAAVDNAIFLRTDSHLYRIEENE
jgi:outer membrane protein assembly factor BamB